MERKFRQVGKQRFRKWSDWEKGDYVVGKFIAQREQNYKGIKPVYDIELETCVFKKREAELPDGTILALNSCGILNKNMKEVCIGDIIKVEFGGKETYQDKETGDDVTANIVNVYSLADDDEAADDEGFGL